MHKVLAGIQDSRSENGTRAEISVVFERKFKTIGIFWRLDAVPNSDMSFVQYFCY